MKRAVRNTVWGVTAFAVISVLGGCKDMAPAQKFVQNFQCTKADFVQLSNNADKIIDALDNGNSQSAFGIIDQFNQKLAATCPTRASKAYEQCVYDEYKKVSPDYPEISLVQRSSIKGPVQAFGVQASYINAIRQETIDFYVSINGSTFHDTVKCFLDSTH